MGVIFLGLRSVHVGYGPRVAGAQTCEGDIESLPIICSKAS
jgi:hypothetical protein